jgi:hypothetical protein
MHRAILEGAPQVDHIDGDGLNNQRSNLRPATQAQNMANSRKYSTNTSGFKGVGWHKAAKKWRADITFDYKTRYLGLFPTAEDAARAYDSAAKSLFGVFACLNFPA